MNLFFILFFFQSQYTIVPQPDVLMPREGYFWLPQTPIIAVAGTDTQVRQLAESFATQLGKVTGRDTKVFAGNFRIRTGINFVTNKSPRLGQHGYRLEINPAQITITAERINGFENGLNALKQLMPPAFSKTICASEISWKIPCYQVEYFSK